MDPKYSSFKIQSDGFYTVVDSDYQPHRLAADFLSELSRQDKSTNTIKKYAGQIACYLNYCDRAGIEWNSPSRHQLLAYLHWLAETPYQHPVTGRVLTRTNKTANSSYRTTTQFLSFCVDRGAASRLLTPAIYRHSERRHYGGTERAHYTTVVNVHRYKLPISSEAKIYLKEAEVQTIKESALNSRDRLLLELLSTTGLRIGEALGLRKEDLHLLPENDSLNCGIKGAHLHIRRRKNENAALAKSRHVRHVPLLRRSVQLYGAYLDELDMRNLQSNYVFVNFSRGAIGNAMSYRTVDALFKRISKDIGRTTTPHDLRHYCATEWLDRGVKQEVVQALLGHRSMQSMDQYVHPSNAQMRSAIRLLEDDH